MLLTLLPVAYLWLFAQEPGTEEIRNQKRQTFVQQAESAAGRIFYIQDPRSNLCFAAQWVGSHSGSLAPFATVPCDAVEHLLATQEAPSP
jgi:hypothetical protein